MRDRIELKAPGLTRLATVTLAILLATWAAQAQQEPTPQGQGDTLGWHLVRPGDTLEEITESYLGTSALWQENWRLNPHVTNPHLLRIGDRLRVIVHRTLPPQTAEVRRVRNRVEARPHPNPWTPAAEGDLLKARDGVRTFRRSSAEIAFDDGASLVLTESSLVFLRVLEQSLVGVSRETIEVVEGQADLEARPSRADSSDIEIVLGEARARPGTGAEGFARSRLRRPEGGGAQVMVYGGMTEVESAGTQISVPAGMGTNVPEGSPPEPPERLLDPPRPSSPAAGAAIGYGNPELAWEPVAGAASYTVELCLDPECKRLLARAAGLETTSWQADSLPEATLQWRVTATSDSGLDGRPSRGRSLVITSSTPDWTDLQTPSRWE
jgi:hypothetical protein